MVWSRWFEPLDLLSVSVVALVRTIKARQAMNGAFRLTQRVHLSDCGTPYLAVLSSCVPVRGD